MEIRFGGQRGAETFLSLSFSLSLFEFLPAREKEGMQSTISCEWTVFKPMMELIVSE